MLKIDSELEIFDLTGRQSLEPRLILNISSVRQYWRYLKIFTWIYLTSQAVLEIFDIFDINIFDLSGSIGEASRGEEAMEGRTGEKQD